MSSIIIDKQIKSPTRVKVQIRDRGDGKKRYSSNLPKGFMDRILNIYRDKKGIYSIDCIKLVIEDGKPFLEIDETKEMI